VKSFFRLILLASILGVSFSSAVGEEVKPLLSKQGLGPKQIEIYRTFLDVYAKGSSYTHHLSNRTYPLNLSSHTRPECYKDIELANLDEAQGVVHEIGREVVIGKKIRLVDSRHFEVTFENGLLSVSEIAFSKDHRFAVFSYSYYCGPLCGQGRTMIFQRDAGGWKNTDRFCGGWLSGEPLFPKDQGL
jgi:hypothetical protein